MRKNHQIVYLFLILLLPFSGRSQSPSVVWAPSGNEYYRIEKNEIIANTLPESQKRVLINKAQLTPQGADTPLDIDYFSFSPDGSKVLLFANTSRVWRINTKGDYYVMDLATKKMKQIGSKRPPSSLMFAKFSPDGSRIAYVSGHNVFVENIATGESKALTTDGNEDIINGTFDWVYEEEFSNRDGIRWSSDGKEIAFWQIDARNTSDFFMINNTDSIYPTIIPVEYPKVGETPSAARVGRIDIASGNIKWLDIPGDANQHYLVRMEYVPGTNDLVVQQLNRKQNETKLFHIPAGSQQSKLIYSEKNNAWIDVYPHGWTDNVYTPAFKHTVHWLAGGKQFLWMTEKDGWNHLYVLSLDGKKELLITPGNYDLMTLKAIDEKNNTIYFTASPENALQKYLFKAPLDGKGKVERLTPSAFEGTNDYNISPTAAYAVHTFSNHYTRPAAEVITLKDHKPVTKEGILQQLKQLQVPKTTEFFKITTADGVEMDGWMVKPTNFSASKKYPVLFYVYTEPASATVTDEYGVSVNPLYDGSMQEDGYIYISLDNRGTPTPKGAAWRKSIYRKIGTLNIRDQAMAAKEILKWPFVDSERIAVWGWSGGGAATLNLMFQYPDIYKTGIAIAAISNQLTYDNVYQERYMGLPQENLEDFVKGSPVTYAKNLKGDLLYIHGTGDDNVHYQNAELLVNELVKHNKIFTFMPYPNRSHGLREGEGTFPHLSNLFTTFLKENCPPGGR